MRLNKSSACLEALALGGDHQKVAELPVPLQHLSPAWKA